MHFHALVLRHTLLRSSSAMPIRDLPYLRGSASFARSKSSADRYGEPGGVLSLSLTGSKGLNVESFGCRGTSNSISRLNLFTSQPRRRFWHGPRAGFPTAVIHIMDVFPDLQAGQTYISAESQTDVTVAFLSCVAQWEGVHLQFKTHAGTATLRSIP